MFERVAIAMDKGRLVQDLHFNAIVERTPDDIDPGKVPWRIPRPNHPLGIEKDQDLLMKLLNVGDVASCTEVDLGMHSVHILESQKPLEVLDKAYRTVAPPPQPPLSGSSKMTGNLDEKKKRHHRLKKKA
ncbi:hypothetical protein ACLB2K_041988 [Fragaria x ananassa]